MKKSLVVILVLIMSILLISCTANNGQNDNGENSEKPPNSDISGQNNGDNSQNGQGNEVENEEESDTAKPNESIPSTPLIVYDIVLKVEAKEVNIRQYASSKSKIVGKMRRGEALSMLEPQRNGWYKVRYKGNEAYISSSYVKELYFEKTTSKAIERVIDEGKWLIGYPYVWGSQRYHWGNGILNTNFRMGEFDCSALTQYIFYKGAGVLMDVTTRGQVLEGRLVRDNIERGDVMFFTNSARRHKKGIEKVGHVAVYLGDNYILHTATNYAVIEEISSDRWSNYLVSKRFI